MRFVKSVRAKNLLSFGDPGIDFELQDLNVIIGPNSSGKSNLVSLFSLLRGATASTAGKITDVISTGGGAREWLWKGAQDPVSAELGVAIARPVGSGSLYYSLAFREEANRFLLLEERLDPGGRSRPFYHWKGEEHAHVLRNGKPMKEPVEPGRMSMSHRWIKSQYPELAYTSESLASIRIFQDWQFGWKSGARYSSYADMPSDFLAEDAGNLAIVIGDLIFHGLESEILRFVQLADPSATGVKTLTQAGGIQLFVVERQLLTPAPAARLSKGVLQLLSLAAILLHPAPPKLICIEEPENGLHPDVLTDLAKLLMEASARTQLIVTTHSEVLVDSLTSCPETVVVCEKFRGETSLKRLAPEEVRMWQDGGKSLGQVWSMGAIGGNRW